MNIVFLDIDSVLNYGYEAPGRSRDEAYGFADALVANLKYILDSVPDTKIVVSSSWRLERVMEHVSKTENWRNVLERKLGSAPCGLILGDVPYANEFPNRASWTERRGEDIKAWLDAYSKPYGVERFVVLDDNVSCGSIPFMFPDEFVNMDRFKVGEGLSKRNADIAISVLKNERKKK